MLFKKIHKVEMESKHENDETEELSEEELEFQFQRQLRKLNFKRKIKNILIYSVIGLALIGGYKSLFQVEKKTPHEEIENQSFITQYIKNYYVYPKTDETNEFLKLYTSQTDISNDFNQNLERGEITSCEIYKVESDEKKDNVLHYYVSADYKTKMKEKEASTEKIYCKISVAKVNDSYLVIRPISNVSHERKVVDDKEILDSFKFEAHTTTQTLDDDQKKEIENTITLFLKTYNEDIVQARLLTTDPSIIDALDLNTKLALDHMNDCSSDDENIYVTAQINANYKDIYISKRNYYFVIDKEKNKIKNMEVF